MSERLRPQITFANVVSCLALFAALGSGAYGGPDAPVFPSTAGTPLNPNNLRSRTLDPAAIAAGFGVEVEGANGKKRMRSTVGFHVFRHTCASMLFEAGRNVKQVAEWLGHADPSFTLRTYVHLMDAGVGGAEFFDEAVHVSDGSASTKPRDTARAIQEKERRWEVRKCLRE